MVNEKSRRRGALTLAWAGWLLAAAGAMANVLGLLPRWGGLIVVILMGTGVTASLVLSRMRLKESITEVFVAGLRSATSLAASTEVRLREVHHVLDNNEGLPAPVCVECAQRYPCTTIQILDHTEK